MNVIKKEPPFEVIGSTKYQPEYGRLAIVLHSCPRIPEPIGNVNNCAETVELRTHIFDVVRIGRNCDGVLNRTLAVEVKDGQNADILKIRPYCELW